MCRPYMMVNGVKHYDPILGVRSVMPHGCRGVFHYKTLEPRSIRLLYISEPTNIHTPVMYELIIATLDVAPAFTALSYTWGCPFPENSDSSRAWPAAMEPSLMLTSGRSIPIGYSLFQALTMFEQLKLYGYFWIDAICINQSDIRERSSQVTHMGELYSKAEKVFVWLGEEEVYAKYAMAFIDSFIPNLQALMHSEGHDDYSFYDVRDQSLWYPRTGGEPISKEKWHALATFFERAWFTRAWTFQEVVLAGEVVMYCGSTRIDYNRFRDLLEYLDLSGYESSPQVKDLGLLTTGRDIYEMMWHRRMMIDCEFENITDRAGSHEPTAILDTYYHLLLSAMRSRRATDPRDHVFGIYGIITMFCEALQLANPFIKPDYSMTIAEVFTETSRLILKHSTSLLLLSDIEDRSEQPAGQVSLPSWVPDYTKPSEDAGNRIAYSNYNTSRGQARLLPSINKQTLCLEGSYIDAVSEVGDHVENMMGAGINDDKYDDFCPFYWTARMLLKLPVVYHTGQDRTEVLWRCLIGD